MSEAKKYSVEIFGDYYSLVSDEAEDKVIKVALMLDSSMRTIAKQSGSRDLKRIAILAALQMGSLLVKSDSLCEEIQKKHQELVRLLECV